MRRRGRTTYLVDVSGHDAVGTAAVHAFYAATLDALRGDARRVVADLLPRTEVLSPSAREAAFTLQQRRHRPDLFAPVDRNPFQAVTVDQSDDEQWQALLAIAPYSPDLRLEIGLLRDLFRSEGSLDSVRLRLRPEQLARVRDHLAAAAEVPEWLGLRPR